jgi:hypothetical protein
VDLSLGKQTESCFGCQDTLDPCLTRPHSSTMSAQRAALVAGEGRCCILGKVNERLPSDVGGDLLEGCLRPTPSGAARMATGHGVRLSGASDEDGELGRLASEGGARGLSVTAQPVVTFLNRSGSGTRKKYLVLV